MKFRKKPVVIDAIQWTGSNADEISDWLTALRCEYAVMPAGNGELNIQTLEDGHDGRVQHVGSAGDWLIRGVQGEVYACKPDIFEATYDRAEDAA